MISLTTTFNNLLASARRTSRVVAHNATCESFAYPLRATCDVHSIPYNMLCEKLMEAYTDSDQLKASGIGRSSPFDASASSPSTLDHSHATTGLYRLGQRARHTRSSPTTTPSRPARSRSAPQAMLMANGPVRF
jgi:hypothetical protein